ncbi:hypothetical protein OIO90_006554 [Microbotryomycetes sp. JL221]|nr:hypothetical protein OIO90_006554 [Microbotryomycetes sp. JL221]
MRRSMPPLRIAAIARNRNLTDLHSSSDGACRECPSDAPSFNPTTGSCQSCSASSYRAVDGCPCSPPSAPYWSNRCPGPVNNAISTPAGIRLPVRYGRLGNVEKLDTSVKTGQRPSYVATVLFNAGQHAQPGKLESGVATAGYGGLAVKGPFFDVLEITSDMRWVTASGGTVPTGCDPIRGGYEANLEPLYHALAKFGNNYIAGKTGPSLTPYGGATFAWQGGEANRDSGYEILCRV